MNEVRFHFNETGEWLLRSKRMVVKNQPSMLFIAGTPFQVMVTVLLAKRHRSNASRIDCILVDWGNSFEEILAGLKESEIFDTVYGADRSFEEVFPSSPRLYSAFQMVAFRDSWLKKYRGAYVGGMPERQYDVLWTSAVTPFTLAVKNQLVGNGSTRFFEDGGGTYNGVLGKNVLLMDDILPSGAERSFKDSLKKGFAKAIDYLTSYQFRLHPTSVYVFQPDSLEGVYPELEVIGIGRPQESDFEILREILPVPESHAVQRAKIIFLAAPNELSREYHEAEDRAWNFIASFANQEAKIAYRLHPRYKGRKDIGADSNLLMDTGEVSWEMLCMIGAIDDSKVIASFGSSAMTTPNRLFSLEPTLVYLDKLLPRTVPESSYWSQKGLKMKALYHEPERIHEPRNETELQSLMVSIVSESKRSTRD